MAILLVLREYKANKSDAASNAAPETISVLPLEPPRFPPDASDLFAQARLTTGEILWRGHDSIYGGDTKLIAVRWNPSTGAAQTIPLPLRQRQSSVIDIPEGLLFVGGTAEGDPHSLLPVSNRIAFIAPDGKVILGKLHTPRAWPKLLSLTDNSILVVGGVAEWSGQTHEHFPERKRFSNTIEVVRLVRNEIRTEQFPDIPGPVRRGYAVVELANGEIMVLGGDQSNYLGCSNCVADTYILNLKTKEWRAGPKMLEGRAYPSATLLTDGSVLVAGGWTPGHGWQEGPSRSVERLQNAAATFVAESPLLTGVARHEAIWIPGEVGGRLLIAGGSSASIQGYDVAKRSWQMLGETCGRYQAGVVAPFVLSGRAYLWLFDDGRSNASSPHCDIEVTKHALVSLRLDSRANKPFENKIDDQSGIALFRNRMLYVPASKSLPALFIGGNVPNEPEDIASTAVDAIYRDNRIKSMGALAEPLSSGSAFNLEDNGIAVLSTFNGNGGRSESKATIQWISQNNLINGVGGWQVLYDAFDPNAIAFGQLGNRIIVIGATGDVDLLAVEMSPEGKPTVAKKTLPSMIKSRQSDDRKVIVRGLADGRIIVAGGAEKMYDDAAGVASFLPAVGYEIYDSGTNSWQESVASDSGSGIATILDDGRVVKLNMNDRTLEVSTAAGTSWQRIESSKAPLVQIDHARLFEIDGEIFLSGNKARTGTGGGELVVQWLNATKHSWDTIWEAQTGANWRFDVGRIVVTVLGNGKRIVLPVEGI